MNNYFCVLPFYGYEYSANNTGTHCCLLPADYNISKIQSDMLNGVRSPACSACWKLEDSNIKSDRQIKNETFDAMTNRDINIVEQETKINQHTPQLIKHITSNRCNATCVSCNAGASSAWGILEKKTNPLFKVQNTKTTKSDIAKLNFAELVGINFVGGEPLIEPLNFYILEELIKANNTDCFISYTTNGSVSISNSNKKTLSRFKNLNIGLSIDGVGPVFEYLRYPLKWKSLLKNLKFFRDITSDISANQCISNLSVLYHTETVHWFNSENLMHHYNPVVNPAYFQPPALPQAVKQQILLDNPESSDLQHLIGQHNKSDEINFAAALVELKQQDKLKNISIANYLPKLAKLIL